MPVTILWVNYYEICCRVLITMMPWWNRSAAQLREQLEREGIPTFRGQVRRRQGKPSGPGRWGR
jgi:hypothetical protein